MPSKAEAAIWGGVEKFWNTVDPSGTPQIVRGRSLEPHPLLITLSGSTLNSTI